MKAIFGMLSLLVVLAIVGLIAVKQLKAVGRVEAVSAGTAGAASAAGVAVPALSGSGSVREQSQAMQKRIADDAVKALNEGAAARQTEADK